ncbi:MAG: ABC transporter substrate-binding protein [Bacillota bacterium]|nr:ABC transporter substrate-binding protein [Bacillota bacterium]
MGNVKGRMRSGWSALLIVSAALLVLPLLCIVPATGQAQQPEQITWITTTALPTVIQEALGKFHAQHPDIRVNWRPTPSGKIRDIALSLMVGNPDDLDVLAIMYGDLAAFVESGQLTNIEGLAWTGTLKRDLKPTAQSNASYKGALYGVPYFHAVHVYVYNMRLLKQAGFQNPPRSWDEVIKVATTMRQRKMFNSPIVWPWNVTATADSVHWTWELITASMGGTLWDKALKPQFLDKSSPGHRALRWMVDNLRGGLIDRTSFELDPGKIVELLGRGDIPMGFQVSFHELIRINSPGTTKEAGNFAIGAGPDKGINVARTDIFVATARARARGGRHWQAVETFMRWLAVPDNFGRPYGALNARGMMFRAFDTDPQVRDAWSKWVDLGQASETMARLTTFVDIVPQYMRPYFPEMRDMMNQELQKALLGQQTVEQALQTISSRADAFATRR